ncbi:hypothetical protein CHS0354_017624 [Potamilus streckersoni]|uniref:Receptor-binding cancer antigen expressed on SiSo cells n=1 Tax=Potamilus streckersoni TaxID=2493646 RepID=A0AAE0RNZ9_9BIVA|nr:hypothetical protein CHS0354_017624 [Potamilus streckersoni]
MLKVVWNVVKKVFGIIFIVFSPLKRLVCRRKRRLSDTVLPLTNHYPTIETLSDPLPSSNQYPELGSWDSWEANGGTSNHQRSKATQNYQRSPSQSVEPEPDIDYFQDMTPAIRKPKKILIKPKEDVNTSAISSKLAMKTDVPILQQGSDLGVWDETTNTWEEEAGEDLSWQADEAMRENRRLERQQRSLEQQRKKQQREAMKSQRKDGQFSAVKLSS